MSNLSYWNEIYRKLGVSEINHLKPSQFAAFCLGELNPAHALLDCGCGNARDSLFFSRYGVRVIAVDGSAEAIGFGQALMSHHSGFNLDFEQLDFAKTEQVEQFAHSLPLKDLSIYSRFFLHAITEEEQDNFFMLCNQARRPGTQVFLEFRTTEDAHDKKVTGEHYRRFIEPDTIVAALADNGYQTTFHCEGQGYAKYRDEDAYVARIIAESTE